jgi:hypothetical protein
MARTARQFHSSSRSDSCDIDGRAHPCGVDFPVHCALLAAQTDTVVALKLAPVPISFN